MSELLLSLAVLSGLGGLSLAVLLLPPLTLMWGSLALSIAGMSIGVPAGVLYHLALRRALLARGALPRGWLWRPTALQKTLDEPAQRALAPWFAIGAAGFLLTLAGAALSVLTIATHFR